MSAEPLLSVRDLRVAFATRAGPSAAAVDGVSFDLGRGEALALVGESGCGKSATALALPGLLPPTARVTGSVRLEGRELLALRPAALRAVRGAGIGVVFQEPLGALNPVLRVGEQVAEALRLHRGLGRAAARARVAELFAEVDLPRPDELVDAFPHQLSGGMRQRVVLAMALACEPRVLVADEPTTALDATVQAQVLALLRELLRRRGTALLLVTHDLGVVAEVADRVAVLYAGRVVETAGVGALFDAPRHPYTRALLAARPELARRGERLAVIAGQVPAPDERPAGCAFRPRCAHADARCGAEEPQLRALGGVRVACHHAEALAEEVR